MPIPIDPVTYNLTGKNIIYQGATYYFEPLIFIGEDYSQWLIRGQLRRNYDDPDILASILFIAEYGTLTIEDRVYENTTVFYPRLPSTVTETLPPTTIGTPVIGKNAWVYDVELENPEDEDEVYKLIKGIVQVSPEVTK